MYRNLPYHSLIGASGLMTKLDPSTVAGKALRVAKNVDGWDEFRSIGKVPGSTRVSDQHPAAVVSLHQFEFTDLDLARKRHQLSLSNGTLYRIESDKSLTALQSGLYSEALVGVRQLDRIHLTSRNQRALTTGGIKYDGTNVRNWGVLAPGTEETVVEPLDVAANWSPSTDVTRSADAAVSQDGTASIRVDKTGTASAEAYIERTSLATNLSGGSGLAAVWLFIPSGGLQKLPGSGAAAEVILGDSGLTNADRHQFSAGELVPGWNLLSLVLAAPDAQDGTGATLSSIDTIRLRIATAASSTTFTHFRWDRLLTYSLGRPSAAIGAAGALDGTVSYRITYLTENGLESNAGDPSAAVSPSSEQVDLTSVPVSPDTQVIARRIYRDFGGDNVFRFVDQINDNVTTTYTDNVSDAALGLAQPPIAGDDQLDSSPPGRLRSAVVHKNRVVGVQADNHFTLVICEAGQPEAARIVDQLQLEEEIVALESHGFGTLIYATDKTFVLRGDGITTPLTIEQVNPDVGANGFRAVAHIGSANVVVREREVYLMANPIQGWLLNGTILDEWASLAPADFADLHIVHDRSRYRVVFFPKDSTDAYVLQYGTLSAAQVSGDGRGVDPLDLRQSLWFKLSLPAGTTPRCSAAVERTADLPELWFGGDDGYVYWAQDPSATDYASGTGTAAVDCEFEYHAVPLGADLGGRGEPRYLRVPAVSSGASTWDVTVTLLTGADGEVVATKTWSIALPSGSSERIYPVPYVGARAQWARVKFANANAGESAVFRPPTLYYIPRADFRGKQP